MCDRHEEADACGRDGREEGGRGREGRRREGDGSTANNTTWRQRRARGDASGDARLGGVGRGGGGGGRGAGRTWRWKNWGSRDCAGLAGGSGLGAYARQGYR